MNKLLIILFTLFACGARADNGYQLWLRYDKLSPGLRLHQYREAIQQVVIGGNSPTIAAARKELASGLSGLLGRTVPQREALSAGSVVIGTPASSPVIAALRLPQLATTGTEGFLVQTVKTGTHKAIVITGNTDLAVLYGVFRFLQLLQTEQDISRLSVTSIPKIKLRVLDHWDNPDGSVERGYAGGSLWHWHTLPGYPEQRYTDYARANAAIGINGTVLNNVNANAIFLTPAWLEKTAALASVFRAYGIKVYLSARFSAPVDIGGLPVSDPLDERVIQWWKQKADEVYRYIPDFGGFLVKANSEGQPGPQHYGRSHADGANMLARALAPHGGVVIWRAFVYSNETPEDRFKQSYNEFKPLDGKFDANVLLQVKNGPIDFQPREPFHPLFGAMPQTQLMMEFQLTQEYLGQATQLVFEAPLFRECLEADTYAKGPGSTVARVIDGSLDGHALTGIAGVANTGSAINWTAHPFAQANWFAFGRLAWNQDLPAAAIAAEWLKLTFTNNPKFTLPATRLMLRSWPTLVSYMTPLGLHHIMGYGHHYGPAPWFNSAPRADWNPVYFHRADSAGIGFDRTATGSNALAQYAPEAARQWADAATCSEAWLLWFHHVSWNHRLPSGKTLWETLCSNYQYGVNEVRAMQQTWDSLQPYIDEERFAAVRRLLSVQEKEAVWWRDACLQYFGGFSKMPLPAGCEPPAHPLSYYESLQFPFAPGTGK